MTLPLIAGLIAAPLPLPATASPGPDWRRPDPAQTPGIETRTASRRTRV